MRYTNSHQSGFTLIEMLIVIPFVLLVIAGLIVAITSLTGDSLGTRSQAEAAYEAQDALNRIEASVLRATKFPKNIAFDSSVNSKQGSDNSAGTQTFMTASAQGRLIVRLPATDTSDFSADREILYATKSDCNNATIATNPIYPITIVYFLEQGTLYERTIRTLPFLDPDYSGYTNLKACSRKKTDGFTNIWQRPSCREDLVLPTNTECKTSDGVLATSVDNFTVTYLNKASAPITAAIPADTDTTTASGIQIDLTIGKRSGSKEISIPMKLTAQSRNL